MSSPLNLDGTGEREEGKTDTRTGGEPATSEDEVFVLQSRICPDWQTRFLVDDKDICFGMIDLDDVEWTRGSEHSWNSSCSLHDFDFAPSFGALLQVDVFETGFNRPTMRRLKPGRDATRLHIPNQ